VAQGQLERDDAGQLCVLFSLLLEHKTSGLYEARGIIAMKVKRRQEGESSL
jgi:hypothetical protein